MFRGFERPKGEGRYSEVLMQLQPASGKSKNNLLSTWNKMFKGTKYYKDLNAFETFINNRYVQEFIIDGVSSLRLQKILKKKNKGYLLIEVFDATHKVLRKRNFVKGLERLETEVSELENTNAPAEDILEKRLEIKKFKRADNIFFDEEDVKGVC